MGVCAHSPTQEHGGKLGMELRSFSEEPANGNHISLTSFSPPHIMKGSFFISESIRSVGGVDCESCVIRGG